jgi:hypothetical protein
VRWRWTEQMDTFPLYDSAFRKRSKKAQPLQRLWFCGNTRTEACQNLHGLCLCSDNKQLVAYRFKLSSFNVSFLHTSFTFFIPSVPSCWFIYSARFTFCFTHSFSLSIHLLIQPFKAYQFFLSTTRFNIQKFYMVLALHWVFCTDLRTDSDFCFIHR